MRALHKFLKSRELWDTKALKKEGLWGKPGLKYKGCQGTAKNSPVQGGFEAQGLYTTADMGETFPKV